MRTATGPAALVGACLLLGLAGCAAEPEGWELPPDGPHEAYVDRVLSELAEIHADTLEEFARTREIGDDVAARLEATFTPEEARHRRTGLGNVLANDLEGFSGDQGPRPVAVRSLPRVADGCVLAEIDVPLASGPAGVEPPADAAVVVELHRADVDEATNPTGWVIAREELVPDGDVEADPGCR